MSYPAVHLALSAESTTACGALPYPLGDGLTTQKAARVTCAACKATIKSIRKPYNDRAGYVASLRSGVVGSDGKRGWVVIYIGEEQGIPESDGGKYAVVCETHGTLVQTTNLPNARSAMKDPREWCECCDGRCGASVFCDAADLPCAGMPHGQPEPQAAPSLTWNDIHGSQGVEG